MGRSDVVVVIEVAQATLPCGTRVTSVRAVIIEGAPPIDADAIEVRAVIDAVIDAPRPVIKAKPALRLLRAA
jgi:hypothetical protein